MSISDILAELPKLKPDELDLVFERALELRDGILFEASPELLNAIEEADAESSDNDIDISEAERIVKTWNTK